MALSTPITGVSRLQLAHLLGIVLLSGCAATTQQGQSEAQDISGSSPAISSPSAPVPARTTNTFQDFSGYWEKNYGRSDDFANRFNSYVADIRRIAFNQSRGEVSGLQLNTRGINADAINGLARFTEELTRSPALVIEQDQRLISIERENDFTLRCLHGTEGGATARNAFGAEICGWNDQRLIIRMELSGGLNIAHQFSLSPDTSQLNVTTTVSSAQASLPFVISNYYDRYEAPQENYECTLTLTRNRVCTQIMTPESGP